MKMVRCTREYVAPSGNSGSINLPTGILLAVLKSKRSWRILALCSFLFVGASAEEEGSEVMSQAGEVWLIIGVLTGVGLLLFVIYMIGRNCCENSTAQSGETNQVGHAAAYDQWQHSPQEQYHLQNQQVQPQYQQHRHRQYNTSRQPHSQGIRPHWNDASRSYRRRLPTDSLDAGCGQILPCHGRQLTKTNLSEFSDSPTPCGLPDLNLDSSNIWWVIPLSCFTQLLWIFVAYKVYKRCVRQRNKDNDAEHHELREITIHR